MCHISVVYKKIKNKIKTSIKVFLVKKTIFYLIFYLFKSTSLHKSQLGKNVKPLKLTEIKQ